MRRDDTTNIVRIDGVLDTDYPKETYSVYARAGDVFLEADFCELARASKAAGEQYFSVNVQRRYMAEGQISLFAVNNETKELFNLDTFEVTYEK